MSEKAYFEIIVIEERKIKYKVEMKKDSEIQTYSQAKAYVAQAVLAVGTSNLKEEIIESELTIDGEELEDCYLQL